MTTKPYPRAARLEIERLRRLLESERERAESAWAGMRRLMWEHVDMRLKLEAVEAALKGETMRDVK